MSDRLTGLLLFVPVPFVLFLFTQAPLGPLLSLALGVLLPLGWLGASRGRPPLDRPRVPFPVHIQALIGTAAVLWLFRLIGIAWLALAVLHLTRRLGLSVV